MNLKRPPGCNYLVRTDQKDEEASDKTKKSNITESKIEGFKNEAQNQSPDLEEEEPNCCICYTGKSEVYIEPCLHCDLCVGCVKELTKETRSRIVKCPLCKQEVTAFHVYTVTSPTTVKVSEIIKKPNSGQNEP